MTAAPSSRRAGCLQKMSPLEAKNRCFLGGFPRRLLEFKLLGVYAIGIVPREIASRTVVW